jgi:phospholipase/carboxylesterase
MKYGGVAAFTGGLLGDKIYLENYLGDFDMTPIFIGTSDPDPHVPVERVYATVNVLKNINADVTQKVYKNMGHTISEDEINMANSKIFNIPAMGQLEPGKR